MLFAQEKARDCADQFFTLFFELLRREDARIGRYVSREEGIKEFAIEVFYSRTHDILSGMMDSGFIEGRLDEHYQNEQQALSTFVNMFRKNVGMQFVERLNDEIQERRENMDATNEIYNRFVALEGGKVEMQESDAQAYEEWEQEIALYQKKINSFMKKINQKN